MRVNGPTERVLLTSRAEASIVVYDPTRWPDVYPRADDNGRRGQRADATASSAPDRVAPALLR